MIQISLADKSLNFVSKPADPGQQDGHPVMRLNDATAVHHEKSNEKENDSPQITHPRVSGKCAGLG